MANNNLGREFLNHVHQTMGVDSWNNRPYPQNGNAMNAPQQPLRNYVTVNINANGTPQQPR